MLKSKPMEIVETTSGGVLLFLKIFVARDDFPSLSLTTGHSSLRAALVAARGCDRKQSLEERVPLVSRPIRFLPMWAPYIVVENQPGQETSSCALTIDDCRLPTGKAVSQQLSAISEKGDPAES